MRPRQKSHFNVKDTTQPDHTMKGFSSLSILLLSFVISVTAFSIELGLVTINGKESFPVGTPKDIRGVTVETARDKISIDVKLSGELDGKPNQLYFLLTNNKGLDFPIFPEFHVSSNSVKVSFTTSQIPTALQAEEKISVDFVASNTDNLNLLTTLFEIVPAEAFKESINYKAPIRLGALPEIHHLFKEDPKTVNPIVPVLFSGFAIALMTGLFAVWASWLSSVLFANNTAKFAKGVFLTTLALFEGVFFKYYLGSSIFTTLFCVAVVSGPSLVFGAKALRALHHYRVKA